MDSKTLVTTALTALFDTREPLALDRYWSPHYIQHSALAEDGLNGARALTKNLPDDFRYELVRTISEGDFVVTHGVYHGFGPQPMIAFDLWRVENGLIAEHWDALMPKTAKTASGHSEVDGPTHVLQPSKTQDNKALIERFLDTVVIAGRFELLPNFFSGDHYIQHNPLIRNQVSELFADFEMLSQQGRALVITKLHRVVAEGEFVFAQSAGTIGEKPAVFYDLWRVEEGKIAEHWDVFAEQPTSLPHSNGLF